MTAATSLLKDNGGFAMQDPVTEITTRIERARARTRQQRSSPPTYPLFEDGQFLGAIRAPKGTPAFGPAAPTVLLTKER